MHTDISFDASRIVCCTLRFKAKWWALWIFFPLWMPLFFFLSLLNLWHHSFSSKPWSSFLNRIYDCLFVPLFHSDRILLYLLSFISVCSHSRSRDALPEFWAITTKVNKRQWLFYNNIKTIAAHKYVFQLLCRNITKGMSYIFGDSSEFLEIISVKIITVRNGTGKDLRCEGVIFEILRNSCLTNVWNRLWRQRISLLFVLITLCSLSPTNSYY